MGKCSICGTDPAVLVDQEHKATYWMCGNCVFESIETKMQLTKALEASIEDMAYAEIELRREGFLFAGVLKERIKLCKQAIENARC